MKSILVADTRKDVGRGHQSRISALHHALGGHIVEMDDSVPCGIRLDGELICQGLAYALIRPEVVALRPMKPKPWPQHKPLALRYPEDACTSWLKRLQDAEMVAAPAGLVALEACCLGIPLQTWPGEDNWAQYSALMQLSHEERFQVIDGLGGQRVAWAIKATLTINSGSTIDTQPDIGPQ